MIARVTLEIALRKEFDYFIPPELAEQIEVGSRVQVPFGSRKVLGCVTGLAEESAHARLKPIIKVLGAQSLVTPKILKLARWIGDYYCCAPETALKSVLPEAVRHEQANWRERLHVRVLPTDSEVAKLPKRQKEVWRILQERPELPLSELLVLAKTTAATVRRMEDRGLLTIVAEISERDPYAREHILPSQPLVLNPAQASALVGIMAAMDGVPKSEGQSPKPKVEALGVFRDAAARALALRDRILHGAPDGNPVSERRPGRGDPAVPGGTGVDSQARQLRGRYGFDSPWQGLGQSIGRLSRLDSRCGTHTRRHRRLVSQPRLCRCGNRFELRARPRRDRLRQPAQRSEPAL